MFINVFFSTHPPIELSLSVLMGVGNKASKGWAGGKKGVNKQSHQHQVMKIEYDREADALYIQLREVVVEDNLDIEEGVTVDLDGCPKP